ncbi:MAG: hypothetical protein ACI9MB_004957, partial [Verrucomicrobiales bacterium]
MVANIFTYFDDSLRPSSDHVVRSSAGKFLVFFS